MNYGELNEISDKIENLEKLEYLLVNLFFFF